MLADLDLPTLVLAAFLAFCRIGACFMIMPGFSSVRIAIHVRLFIALAVTWALLAHLWDDIVPHLDRGTDGLLLLVGSELLIGGTIGAVTRFYVLALQFAASAIAMTSGFNAMGGSMVEEMEPQAALTVLISFTALLLLFVFDFHHEIIKALVASYSVAPLAALFSPQSALIDVVDTLSRSFYVTLRLASPFIAYAILVNLAIGFLNKLTPHIPVYFISLPFVLAGGLIMLYFGIGVLLSLFVDGFLPTTLAR